MESLRKQLFDVQAEVKELKTSKAGPNLPNILENFNAPLAEVAKNACLPKKFKMPHLNSYQGQTYPMTHVEVFQDIMLLVQGALNEVMYKMFPTTLSK